MRTGIAIRASGGRTRAIFFDQHQGAVARLEVDPLNWRSSSDHLTDILETWTGPAASLDETVRQQWQKGKPASLECLFAVTAGGLPGAAG